MLHFLYILLYFSHIMIFLYILLLKPPSLPINPKAKGYLLNDVLVTDRDICTFITDFYALKNECKCNKNFDFNTKLLNTFGIAKEVNMAT